MSEQKTRDEKWLQRVRTRDEAREAFFAYVLAERRSAGRKLWPRIETAHDVGVAYHLFSLNPMVFSDGTQIEWGKLNGWTAWKNPNTYFKPELLLASVPCAGVGYLNQVSVTSEAFRRELRLEELQHGGCADLYSYARPSHERGEAEGLNHADLGVVAPTSTLQVVGTWAGLVPPPFKKGEEYVLCLDFVGWAADLGVPQ